MAESIRKQWLKTESVLLMYIKDRRRPTKKMEGTDLIFVTGTGQEGGLW
jgi:hypothetical protein